MAYFFSVVVASVAVYQKFIENQLEPPLLCTMTKCLTLVPVVPYPSTVIAVTGYRTVGSRV